MTMSPLVARRMRTRVRVRNEVLAKNMADARKVRWVVAPALVKTDTSDSGLHYNSGEHSREYHSAGFETMDGLWKKIWDDLSGMKECGSGCSTKV